VVDPALVTALERALAGEAAVHLALLFGSRARGDHRADSDVDVAVLGPVDRIGLAVRLSDALGLDVDVVALEEPSIPLLRAVLRDAVCVHQQAPGAWGTFLSRALTELETDGPAFDGMQRAFVARVARRGLTTEGR
jgi:predicted nucleotidyltransferase